MQILGNSILEEKIRKCAGKLFKCLLLQKDIKKKEESVWYIHLTDNTMGGEHDWRV